MNRTKIEWVKNPDGTQGYTSNPVRGECPVGCGYCYVKPFRTRYGWHKDIRFYPEELEEIRGHRKPTGIFLGSTIELFHDKTIVYMPEIMETIKACPQHRFYLLTKQPQNLPQFSPFPPNCWVGVTATNFTNYLKAIGNLASIKASIRFISFEPLLGRINHDTLPSLQTSIKEGHFDWLIIGACTGTQAEMLALDDQYNLGQFSRVMPLNNRLYTFQPRIEWVREIVEAADRARIKVFLKDNLKPLIAHTCTIDDKWVWAKDLGYGGLLRQELPSGRKE